MVCSKISRYYFFAICLVLFLLSVGAFLGIILLAVKVVLKINEPYPCCLYIYQQDFLTLSIVSSLTFLRSIVGLFKDLQVVIFSYMSRTFFGTINKRIPWH